MDIQFTVNSQDEFEIDEALALLFEIKERVQRPIIAPKKGSVEEAAQRIETFIDEVIPMPGERQLSIPKETQIAGAIGTVDMVVSVPVIERVDPATITRELATKKGVKEAADVLKEFGAKRVNEIAEDRKAAYVAEVQKRLAA